MLCYVVLHLRLSPTPKKAFLKIKIDIYGQNAIQACTKIHHHVGGPLVGNKPVFIHV